MNAKARLRFVEWESSRLDALEAQREIVKALKKEARAKGDFAGVKILNQRKLDLTAEMARLRNRAAHRRAR